MSIREKKERIVNNLWTCMHLGCFRWFCRIFRQRLVDGRHDTKFREKMSPLLQAHGLDDKNHSFGQYVMHFVNKNKFYPRSKNRQIRGSDKSIYPLFCRFSFPYTYMSSIDKTSRYEPLLILFVTYHQGNIVRNLERNCCFPLLRANTSLLASWFDRLFLLVRSPHGSKWKHQQTLSVDLSTKYIMQLWVRIG